MALTWRSGESESFLDLRTGEVRQCRLSRFADERGDFELSEEEADAGLAAGCLVRVEPLEPSVEYGWMADFAVLLQRIDNVDPLTGATELVYTADENLVRPRELRDAIRALRIGSHDVPRGGGD